MKTFLKHLILPVVFLYICIFIVNAQTYTGQQQGTFDFSSPSDPTPTQPQSNTLTPLPTILPIVDAARQAGCRPSVSELGPIYQINGVRFGWARYAVWQGDMRTAKGGYWYYIPEEPIQDNILQANLENIITTLQGKSPDTTTLTSVPSISPNFAGQQTDTSDYGQKQGSFDVLSPTPEISEAAVNLGDLKVRQEAKIIKDIQTLGEACPLRLTGSSPTLFLYGPEGTEYSVTNQAEITYADPITENNTWRVTTSNDHIIVNDIERNYIYYEYKPVEFLKPVEGWVINKNILQKFVRQILADGLKLTDLEAERGLFELHHAADSIESNNIFIGLISQEEVNEKLPITIEPDPESVYRLHFYVTKANDGENPPAPILYPLNRTSDMALEIGSYAEKF